MVSVKGVTVLALFVGSLLTTVTGGWVNDYDKAATYICPTGQFLSHINSQHSSHYEDRRWDFDCSPVPVEGDVENCDTSSGGRYPSLTAYIDYVNQFDQTFTYQCPGEGFITGMESAHDGYYEDRRFKFQCCELPGKLVKSCYITDWANEYDGELNFHVPTGKILRGVISQHYNYYEDRQFKFEICELTD